MNQTVENRVVKMDFDNKEFSKNAQATITILDKLKQSLNFDNIKDSFSTITGAAKRIDLSSVLNQTREAGYGFDYLEKIAAGAFTRIGTKIADFGTDLVNNLTIAPITTGLSEYELKMDSIQTIMSSTGETIGVVNGYLNELNTYSDRTIYSFSDMTANIGKFTNSGVKLKDAVAAIKGIANEAAVAGANSQQASAAMYNFAQALSSGSVKLIDWKSIENANMATVEFKNELLKTAIEIGTVTKAADGMYEVLTTNGQGASMKETISATQGFNDSLAYQWMTTDVLIKTLQKYTDETTELGKKAYSSASDIKTFTQMLDVWNEAAQSGWSETWELIIGNIEQAKEFYGQIDNIVSGAIGATSDARNAMLNNAFSSSWEKITKQITDAGLSLQDYETVLKSVAKAQGYDVQSAQDLIKDHKLTSEMLGDTMRAYLDYVQKGKSDIVKLDKSSINLQGITQDNKTAMTEFMAEAYKADGAIRNLVTDIDKVSGKDLFHESVINALQVVFDRLSAVGNAFNDVFRPDYTGTGIYTFLENLRDLTKALKTDEKGAENIRKVFRGFFTVIKIGTTIFGGAFLSAFKMVAAIAKAFHFSLFGIASGLGEMLYQIDSWITKQDILNRMLNKGQALGAGAAEKIHDWVNAFEKLPIVVDAMEKMDSAEQRVFNFLNKHFPEGAISVAKVTQALKDLYAWAMRTEFMQGMVTRFGDGFRGAFSDISEYFSGGADAFKDFIGRVKELDSFSLANIRGIFKDFFENVIGYFPKVTGKFDNLITYLTSIRDKLLGFKDAVGDAASGKLATLTKLIERLRDGFSGFISIAQNKAGNIDWHKVFAFAVDATLIAGLFKFASALETLGGPIEHINGILGNVEEASERLPKIMKSLEKSVKGYMKSESAKNYTEAMKNIATAVLELAIAMKVVDTTNPDNWPVTLGFVAGALFIMLGAMFMLVKITKTSKDVDIAKVADSAFNKAAIAAIAVGIKILTKALIQLKDIQPNEVLNAMFALIVIVAILEAAIFGLVTIQNKVGQVNDKSILAFVAIAVALHIVAESFISLGKLSDDEYGKGIIAMAGLMAGMYLLMMFAEKLKFSKAGENVMAIAATIFILAKIVEYLKKVDVTLGLNEVIELIELLGLMAALMLVARLSGKYAMGAAAMIASMALGMFLIVQVIKSMGDITPEEMDKGMSFVKSMAGIFGIMAIALAALSILSKALGAKANFAQVGVMMLAFSLSLVLISGVIMILSKMKQEDINNATGNIMKIMFMFAVMIAATGVMSSAGNAYKTIIALAVSLALMAAALVTLSIIKAEDLEKATHALFMIMGMMALMIAAAGTLGDSNSAMLTLIVMCGMLVIVIGALYLLADYDLPKLVIITNMLSKLMLSLSAMMLAISIAGKLNSNPLPVLWQMFEILGALGVVFTAVGTLVGALDAYGFDISGKIEKGIALLTTISTGLGKIAGGLIGGLAEGITNSFPQIGQNISDFLSNLSVGLDAVKESGIDAETTQAVKNLAETVLILTGNDLLGNINKWLFGGIDYADFGDSLSGLGPALKEFGDSVQGLSDTNILADTKTATDVLKSIASIGDSLPRNGGIIDWILGTRDSFSDFASGFAEFAIGLKDYADAASGLSESNIIADTKTVTDVAKSMNQIAGYLPKEGGLIETLLGKKQSLGEFGSSLVSFAEGIQDYAKAAGGLSNTTIVQDSQAIYDAISRMIKLNDKMGTSGGWIEAIFGKEVSISKFGTDLVSFGTAMVSYSNFCKQVDVEAVDKTTKAIKNLVPRLNEVTSVNADGLVAVANGLNALAGVDMEGMASSYTKKTAKEVGHSMTTMLASVDESIKSYDFTSAGMTIASDVSEGIYCTTSTKRMSDAVKKVCKSCNNSYASYYSDFYDSGVFLTKGVYNGIMSQKAAVRAMAKSVGEEAVEGLNDGAGVHSPSWKTCQSAEFTAEGYINGLRDNVAKVYAWGQNLGSSAVEGFNDSSTFSSIGDGFDNPVIRPILDLSSVESEAARLNSILGMNDAIAISASRYGSAIDMAKEIQNGKNNAVVDAIYGLTKTMDRPNVTNNVVNGVTYDDGSNIKAAVSQLAHAILVNGRS